MTRIMAASEVWNRCSPTTAAANTNLPASPERLNWRTSQRGNSYVIVDGFHMVVFRRQTGQWSFRIEEIETGESWYSADRFPIDSAARAGAFQELERLVAGARPARAVRV